MKRLAYFFLLISLIFYEGCGGYKVKERFASTIAPKYSVDNYYVSSLQDRESIRRVLIADPVNLSETDYSELEKIFFNSLKDELKKIKAFDIVPAKDVLKVKEKLEFKKLNSILTTGNFDSDKLFEIARKYNVQGALFSAITSFKKYPPYVLGVKIFLVNIRTGKVVWAVDEVFDASRYDVKNLAKFYYYDVCDTSKNPSLEWKIVLQSIREYIKFVLNRVVKTYKNPENTTIKK